MKRAFWIQFFLVVQLLGAAVWIVMPKYGHGGQSYRSRERIQAFAAYAETPSPETQATLDSELHRLDTYYITRALLIVLSVVAVDFAIVWYFWKKGDAKSPNPQAA